MADEMPKEPIGEADIQWIQNLKNEMAKVVVGQDDLIDRLILGLLTNGHVLLEGVPGLAKTLTVKTLAQCVSAEFSRIQFTPDLLPGDVVGTVIYNTEKNQFIPQKGPVFANIVLADEINRAPAKVQSALLESMQERQVTIGEETFKLDDPFLVLATENPIDQEGTYPLPEAQVDRFMFKVKIGYPTRPEERVIMDLMARNKRDVEINSVISTEEILRARERVDDIYLDDRIKDYILSIVHATRKPMDFGIDYEAFIEYGASPRATIALTLGARAYAFLRGKSYVTPHDVKAIGADVLRHRILLTYEAEAEEITSEQVIEKVFSQVPIP
ncbi:MAG: MoxR family ATPase [Opitutales bacterium]|nr:MoxR family ATPase [Opitutales bacterium]